MPYPHALHINDFRRKWVNDAPYLPETGPALPSEDVAALFSARKGLSHWQFVFITSCIAGLATSLLYSPDQLLEALYWACWTGFMLVACVRIFACLLPVKPVVEDAFAEPAGHLPTYSVIVALYKEARIATQLVEALDQLVYPRHRLEVLLALEIDDTETLDAFEKVLRGRVDLSYMRIVRVPPGTPRTKPRALNHALGLASGELTVIYDAEDMPDPMQLMAAVRRFAKGPADLACLQAPLRPLRGKGFIARHFAAEYAMQFEVILPALHALKLPFPLGGTSNHFRTDVLRRIGAWDAWNVTEDADLGLRLSQYGYQSGLIGAPTWESPPETCRAWLPQRTRWIKGYMQTLMVHTRLNTPFRPRVWLGMGLSIGLSVLAALSYAPFMALIVGAVLINLVQPHAVSVAGADAFLFVVGTLSAVTALSLGTRRVRTAFTLGDILSLPAYWCLQSLACVFALWQLVTRPFHWDKTEHVPIEARSPRV